MKQLNLCWTSWTENYTGRNKKRNTFRDVHCKYIQHKQMHVWNATGIKLNMKKCANTETTQETHAAENCCTESTDHDCRGKKYYFWAVAAHSYIYFCHVSSMLRVLLMFRGCFLVCTCFLKLQWFVLIGHRTKNRWTQRRHRPPGQQTLHPFIYHQDSQEAVILFGLKRSNILKINGRYWWRTDTNHWKKIKNCLRNWHTCAWYMWYLWLWNSVEKWFVLFLCLPDSTANVACSWTLTRCLRKK